MSRRQPLTTRRVVAAVLGVLALMGGAWAVGLPLHPLLTPVAAVAVIAAGAAVRDRARLTELPWWRPVGRRDALTYDRRLSALTWATHGLRDGRTWDTTLGPLLLDVVEHRLRVHHDIDLRSQPDAARAVLPPELRRLVDDPTTAPTSTKALTTIIARIEEL